jgi:hypothetical protein
MVRFLPTILLVPVLLGLASASGAQDLNDPACDDANTPKPQVVFDHLNTNADRHYTISARPGEPIIVCIRNTALAQFTYSIVGVVKAVAGAIGTATLTTKDLGTRRLTRPHDDQYGGYVVAVKRAAPGDVTVVTGATSKTNLDVTLVVAVVTQQFQYEFAGAFSISDLTDPQYAIVPQTVNGQTKSVIVHDESAKDSSRLGLGAFIHVFHDKFPWLAGTFGLGIAEANRTTYFLGPTLRLGKAMAFTAGPVWGSVKRLPAGVTVGSEAANANVLNDLPTQVKRGWFFGFSYTFLQAKQAIEEPFAPPPAQ